MSRKTRLSLLAAVLVLACGGALGAQVLSQAEFLGRPLREILPALGGLAGKTIIVDDTVTGTGTYFFKDKTFDEAMQVILESQRLYQTVTGDVITVSKVLVSGQADDVTVAAEDVNVELLIKNLARALSITILYDPLPVQNLSLNLTGVRTEQVLDVIARKLEGYSLEVGDVFYYLHSPKTAVGPRDTEREAPKYVTREGDLYSILAESARFTDVVDNLFSAAGHEYSMLRRGDVVIDRMAHTRKSFDELLRLILDVGDSDYTVENGVWRILEANRADILKRFDETRRVTLVHLSLTQLTNMLPSNLATGVAFKLDKASNSVVFQGSQVEVQPILDFIARVDIPRVGLDWYRFDLQYVGVDTVVPVLPDGLKAYDPIALKPQNALVLLLSPERKTEADRFLAMMDQNRAPYVIPLRYVRAEDMLAKLPAFISKDQVSAGPDSRYLFFQGSRRGYEDLLGLIGYLDMPTPQIRYQILAIQFQEDVTNDFKSQGIGATLFGEDKPANSFVTTLSQVLKVNFNIVADFGLNFVAGLEASVKTNKANIVVDSTLNGLSGQEVSFRNTDTDRRQVETTTGTGDTAETKVSTLELVSGIQMTLKGWVSGDGMITMNLTATISRRGEDTTGTAIPQTFEKIVTTSVRTPSGRPVIISGLLQHEEGGVKTAPLLLGAIPGLGDVLSTQNPGSKNTELVIYVIPRVEAAAGTDQDLSAQLMSLYENYSVYGNPLARQAAAP